MAFRLDVFYIYLPFASNFDAGFFHIGRDPQKSMWVFDVGKKLVGPPTTPGKYLINSRSKHLRIGPSEVEERPQQTTNDPSHAVNGER